MAHFLRFSFNSTTRHRYNARIVLLETRAFRRCPICNGWTGKKWFMLRHATNTHNHRHNHGRRRQKWPPNAPNEASSPTMTRRMDWGITPQASSYNFGGGEEMYGHQSSPLFWQWCIATKLSVLRAVHPLNLLRGTSPIEQ